MSLVPRAHLGLFLGVGILVMVLVGGFAFLLLDSQSRLRSESEKRFQSRATVSAALTESIFASAAVQGQRDAAKRFGGRTISSAALAARAKQARAPYLRVLGSKGELLAATPGAPAYRQGEAGLPQHVRKAFKGQPYLSSSLTDAKGIPEGMEWALPFKTRFGLRVIVTGVNPRQLTAFLSTYLARARESSQMEAHVIDDRGHIVSNAAGPGARATRLDPGLATALARKDRGIYHKGATEHYFAAAPVKGSSWSVVVSEPTSVLYPILAGGRTWVLWAVFAAFALAAVLSLLLLKRLLAKATELEGANRELEKQKLAAQEATRAKGDFLANMSHELRTPLTSIIGYSELLMDDADGKPETKRKFLGSVASNARHLDQLVSDILDLSKIEVGKMDFKAQQVDLAAVAEDLTSAMGVLAKQKQIELVTEVSPEIRWIVTDPPRLRQVLYNFLSNALKFTPEGGRVVIRATPEGDDCLRVAVEDNGIGVAEEDRAKLFQQFEQVHDPTGRQSGTGLGLALVKQIVEAQGGRVGLDSRLGEGSVFYAVLPRDTSKLCDTYRAAAEEPSVTTIAG
jgi:signal transduction histidine kinase